MGRKRLEAAGPPGSAARLRVELTAADAVISFITWGSAAGVIVWSMLNATPYVRAHISPGWESVAWVLPVVVDLAFVGSLRADEIASRYGASGGVRAGLLRLFTGASSLFLNIGHSVEKSDATGVMQHLIAPMLLVLLAEAGPAYRRRLSARLGEVEAEEAVKADAAREEQRQEDELRAERDRQKAERQAKADREEADRLRAQKWDDQVKALELEERQEAARADRVLAARRLDLEEKRLDTPAAAAPAVVDAPAPQRYGDPAYRPATVPAPVRVPVAPVAFQTTMGDAAPEARNEAPVGATVAPEASTHATPRNVLNARQNTALTSAADRAAPARVSARVDLTKPEHQEQAEEAPATPPARPTGPVPDWQLPELPADCAPGIEPGQITDDQAHARIRYGAERGWVQRRIATFANRSPSTVHKRMQKEAAAR